jgi:hypothetical protein
MNVFITIIGWIAWNWFWFAVEKDKSDDLDKRFDYRDYARKHWENWVWTLLLVPILLYYGSRGLGLDVFGSPHMDHLKWNDAFYPCVGLFSDIVGMGIKWSRKKLAKIFTD